MYEFIVKHDIGLNTPMRRRLFVNFLRSSFVDHFAVLISTRLSSSLEEKVFEIVHREIENTH